MHALPVMLVLWGAAVGAFVAIMIYRATLTQHETDQLFLSDENSLCNSHVEHDRIVQQVDRLRPFCQGLGGAAVLLTIGVIGAYIAQTIPNMRF